MPQFQITLEDNGASYCAEIDTDTTLLELMREIPLPVRKACRNGACGICRCRLKTGEITYLLRAPFGLWEKEINAGYILPCIAYAVSDLVLTDLTLEPGKITRP